jgi:transcriptional regulator GlxA family with amidase domain
MSNNRPLKISILATPDSTAATLYGLFEVLSTVGVTWENSVSGRPEDPQFDVRIVAATKKPLRCAGNVVLSPHAGFNEADDTDIVVVGSVAVPNKLPLKNFNTRNLDWLSHQKNQGVTIASACTGAIMLAQSGLLNGCIATTHWAYRDLLRLQYPDVKWRIQQELCVSGENCQIVTSAGAMAWQDLALYLITRFCGVEHAANTAKFWLMQSREESQAPYTAMIRNTAHDDAIVNECQRWIAEHYEESNPITAMIAQSGLSSTTFARRFNHATGYRPMDYVHTLRIEEAKQMLEMSDVAIDKVGREVGYEDPASFRRIFKRTVSLTPSVYRRKFDRNRLERYG